MSEMFKEKGFSKETLELINNFINEFEELFGQYLSKEEVIERINNNLNGIDVCDKIEGHPKAVGVYRKKLKNIQIIKKANIEEIKETMFHEMVHCITADEKGIGFDRIYYSDDVELKIEQGVGLNEGTSEYLTYIRNLKFAPELKGTSYPMLTKQIDNLLKLIGKEKYFNIFFHEPEEIEEYLNDYEILNQFDVLWSYEDDVLDFKSSDDIINSSIFGGKR